MGLLRNFYVLSFHIAEVRGWSNPIRIYRVRILKHLMLAHCLRRWANTKTTLRHFFVFAGKLVSGEGGDPYRRGQGHLIKWLKDR